MIKKIILIFALLLSVSLSADDGFSLYIKKDYTGAYNAFYAKFFKLFSFAYVETS